MTILTIIGAIVVTLIPLWFTRNLILFYEISSDGVVDTTKWNFWRQGLWIDFILIPVSWTLWWIFVGTNIHIHFG